jgi:hypothetical protein
MKRDLLPPGQTPPPNCGRNLFLEALGPCIDYMDMSTRLAFSPLKNVVLEGLSATQREDLLALRKQLFVPTTMAQDIAAALQVLHREGYIGRNPHNPEVRRKIFEIANSADKDLSEQAEFFNHASGIIMAGITGVGKSTILDRYLSLLPCQVREYGAGEIPGFTAFKQVVYVKVSMSGDGSRGGFLLGLLSEVDKLLHTDFYEQYSRGRILIDTLLVKVGVILSTHYCGMLIVEEIQPGNFSGSQHMDEIAKFFLRLLNFGIPVVLVGNPLGFTKLKPHTQVTRRLTNGGSFKLHPSVGAGDFDWDELMVRHVWEFDVMPEPTPLDSAIRAKLFERSGGIYDFLVRLRAESQRIALRQRKKAAGIEHIEAAYWGATFVENHNLIRGFATKNIELLEECTDIPVEYYASLWAAESKAKAEAEAKAKRGKPEPMEPDATAEQPPAPAEAPQTTVKTTLTNLEAQFKAAETRANTRAKKVEDLNATLGENDARGSGKKAALIAGIKELQAKLEKK